MGTLVQTHAPFAHPQRNTALFGVEEGMHVADLGSGSGAYTLALAASVGKSGRVYAVDVQKNLLRRTLNDGARRGYTNIEIIWGDLEIPGASKLKDASLDLVLVSNLLFQVADIAPILSEAHRILRPSGRLVLMDWSDSQSALGRPLARLGPQQKDVVTSGEALEAATAAGFDFVREFPAGAHHWGMILRPTSPRL